MTAVTVTGLPGQVTVRFDPACVLALAGGMSGSNATPASKMEVTMSLLSRETGMRPSILMLGCSNATLTTVIEAGRVSIQSQTAETDRSLRVANYVWPMPISDPVVTGRRIRGRPIALNAI